MYLYLYILYRQFIKLYIYINCQNFTFYGNKNYTLGGFSNEESFESISAVAIKL